MPGCLHQRPMQVHSRKYNSGCQLDNRLFIKFCLLYIIHPLPGSCSAYALQPEACLPRVYVKPNLCQELALLVGACMAWCPI